MKATALKTNTHYLARIGEVDILISKEYHNGKCCNRITVSDSDVVTSILVDYEDSTERNNGFGEMVQQIEGDTARFLLNFHVEVPEIINFEKV